MAVIYDMNEGMNIIGDTLEQPPEDQAMNQETLPAPLPALQEVTHTETASPAVAKHLIASVILKKD